MHWSAVFILINNSTFGSRRNKGGNSPAAEGRTPSVVPSSGEEGTPGRHPAVGADPRVCPNKKGSLRSKSFKNLIQNLSKLINEKFFLRCATKAAKPSACSIHDNSFSATLRKRQSRAHVAPQASIPTTPNPSFQKEGTPGRQPAVGTATQPAKHSSLLFPFIPF